MIVKNRYSIRLGKGQSNNQGRSIVTNPKRKINSTPTPPPPTPEDSNTACLNLAPGLYKKKYEGYFNDVNEFFDSTLVSTISIGDIGKSYQILDIGTSTQQDWYSWGFVESPQYDTPEALGLPFPSIGKGVSYFGGGPIENGGTANLGPVLVSESVSSQIDDSYSQAQGQNNKSLIIKGYFKPTVNGVYKFRLYSDDASYLWFGNDALDGNRTISNYVVSLPGIHAPYHTNPPGTFTMVANSYYPLTVEFGNGPDGEGVLIFDYMPPGSDTWTSDLAGKLFYDIDSKGHRVCAPPSAYFGRVLSLDAVPYDENPNQISFDGAGVPTVDGVYVYTQTGSPLDSMFRGPTGFYGPVVNEENNFINLITEAGITGYFVGDWIENNYTYFNTGNIPFVNRVEVTNADFNVNDTYARLNSGDNTFLSINENDRRIVKNQNNGWNLIDDDNIVRYINDDINLDPNGWYYDYINTINLSGFYGYEDGTVYTNEITISGAGTFDDTYRRQFNGQPALETSTIDDNGEYYIPFADTTFISQVVLSNAELSDMNGTYTRDENSAGWEGQLIKTDNPDFIMYWDTTYQRWIIEGPTFYCDAVEDYMDSYAYNPSLDMSANWVTDNGLNGCNKTPPSGSITVSTISDINDKNGLRKIENKGALPLSYGTSMDPFFGWYLYDPMLPDAEFPRYGIHTDDTAPTSLAPYVSVKSFRVSGLTNAADDGVYSRSAGLATPFTKAGSNPIKYEDITVNNEPGWKTWIDVNGEEKATHKLSNSAEITTGGWERKFTYKIVFSGANNIANGTYIWQNQYANEEENLRPVLTVLGSGGTNEPRGWRIVSADDQQADTLFLQSPGPSWYLNEEWSTPMNMGTVMTSQDRGLTWTSPYPRQFNLNGFTGPRTAYNKTYTFTSAGGIENCYNNEQFFNKVFYGDKMSYDINTNTWNLEFLIPFDNNGESSDYLIRLTKTGPSPVGTWTSINSPDYNCYDGNIYNLIITDNIVGSNAIAMVGSGTLPTLSISEIEYVSGDGNYSNPTLTSQISGNIISVDGTYTRNQGATTSLSNGTYTMYRPNGFNGGWIMDIPGAVNGGGAFNNDDFNLAENGWYETSPSVVGTASNTTARYYPGNKTDGLLGIQYSGYFDGDPTWFNTASVKPIINELVLNASYPQPFSFSVTGTYTRVGDQNNQGTYYFEGPAEFFPYNGKMRISYNAQYPSSESYWYVHPESSPGDIFYISSDLINWTNGPEGEYPPTGTITQTQNSENSTNFGTTRALSNDTSWQWVGYFRANDTSNHNFYISADEDAYFWIGDKALNGYTTGNADMYSIAYNSTNITNLPLTSGVYYPVRLQWGHPANPTFAGLSLSYRNGAQASTSDFSGLFFNFTGDGIATNSNGYVYDFTLGEWQSTTGIYDPVPNVAYSNVWLDSISGFNNSGIMYTGNKHVTLFNNPVYSSDYSGVYSFNGIDQYMLTQEVPQAVDGSFSNFIWFKPTGAGVIISELGQPEINNYYHDSQMEINEAGEIHFGVYAYNGFITSDPIDFNRWYHLGLTYSSGVLSAYIDGQKIASNNSERYPDLAASLHYGICAPDSTNMGVDGYGKGSVGSFQAYNKGLTEVEVGNLYSGEKDRFPNIDNMFFPSLWLDASTGISKFDYNYISRIVLTGDASVTGTYNISSSIPTYNFGEGRLNNYSLGNIYWGSNEDSEFAYRVITENLDNTDIGYESNNGVNWSILNSYTSQLIITGFTGIYTGANGTYNLSNGAPSNPAYSNGAYQLFQNQLVYDNPNLDYPVIATQNNDGSFTPVSYDSSLTLSNAGTTSVNGIYTRSDSQIDIRYLPFLASEGRSVYFESNYWFVYGELYYAYGSFDWGLGDGGGASPVPTNSFGTSPRSIGSPRISESFILPSGSITGTITTSNVATDYVTSWEDQSVNGQNAVIEENAVPGSLVEIDDKSFVSFSNTTMFLPAISFVGTIFVVVRFNASSTESYGSRILYQIADSDFQLTRGYNSTNNFYLQSAGGGVFSSVPTNNNTNYLIGATFNSSLASLFLNGTSVGSGPIEENYEPGDLYIGQGEPHKIAEMIVYDRILNTSERQEVESYLADKYAISLA